MNFFNPFMNYFSARYIFLCVTCIFFGSLYLHECSCMFAQGFFFSKHHPLPHPLRSQMVHPYVSCTGFFFFSKYHPLPHPLRSQMVHPYVSCTGFFFFKISPPPPPPKKSNGAPLCVLHWVFFFQNITPSPTP